MADKIISIEIPITESELRRLQTSAILTGSGTPSEALRLQAGLPRIEKLIAQIESEPPVGLPYEYSDSKVVVSVRSGEYGDEIMLQENGNILLRMGSDVCAIESNLFQEFVLELDKHCALPVFDTIRDAAYADGYADGREEKS